MAEIYISSKYLYLLVIAFGSWLILAQRTFGALGFSFVRSKFNLDISIDAFLRSNEFEFESYLLYGIYVVVMEADESSKIEPTHLFITFVYFFSY